MDEETKRPGGQAGPSLQPWTRSGDVDRSEPPKCATCDSPASPLRTALPMCDRCRINPPETRRHVEPLPIDPPKCDNYACDNPAAFVRPARALCDPCRVDFFDRLRRRVARRSVGLDPDSPVGVGLPLAPPPTEWALPGYWLLQCDMCPRRWVGFSHEVCDTCRMWWLDALRDSTRRHERRRHDVA